MLSRSCKHTRVDFYLLETSVQFDHLEIVLDHELSSCATSKNRYDSISKNPMHAKIKRYYATSW